MNGLWQRVVWASVPALLTGFVAYGGMRVEISEVRSDVKEIREEIKGTSGRAWRIEQLERRQQNTDSVLGETTVAAAVTNQILADIRQSISDMLAELKDMRKLADQRFRAQDTR